MRGGTWIGELRHGLRPAKGPEVPPALPRFPIAVGSGNVHVLLEHVRPRTGTVIGREEQTVTNHVVLGGRNIVRDMILNIGAAPTHMAFGSGSGLTVDSDRRLNDEKYRAEFTRRYAAGSKAIFRNFLAAAEPSNQPFTIAEIGLFSVSNYLALGTPPPGGIQSGSAIHGTMFGRALITPFEKNDETQVTFTWELPITSLT